MTPVLVDGGNSQDDLVDVHGLEDPLHIGNLPLYRDSVDPVAHLSGIIIKEALDRIAALGIVLQFLQQLHAGRTGAYDCHGGFRLPTRFRIT